MNVRLLSKLLGVVALLIGVTMVFSLPWAHPALGHRTDETAAQFEWDGFLALLGSMAICFAVGAGLWWFGRREESRLYRKEAMAVVGLSWVLATALGAIPYLFAGCYRSPSVRLFGPDRELEIYGKVVDELAVDEYAVIEALVEAGARGIAEDDLVQQTRQDHPVEILKEIAVRSQEWAEVVLFPGEGNGPPDRRQNYRIRWTPMDHADALFESQSGFSTTGATVLSDLEDPELIPHCILFWRSSTHFLGGLGIIVLFVAILGQGSAGKALMRAEVPGPSADATQSRMQHTAWVFAAIYCSLNVVLAIILRLLGMTWFDAICHAFGTMATGGFSTFNGSLGHFDSAAIDGVVIVFMVLAGTNFTLMYYLVLWQPKRFARDAEWRTFLGIIVLATLLIMAYGIAYGDFLSPEQREVDGIPWWQQLGPALRYGLFQVVSILTTTGFGTADFDKWNSFARALLFLLMFIGGCAGSTGGGLKVIRHILFYKVLRLEIEHAFHPSVVRPLRISGKPVDDPGLGKNVLVYFGLILAIFALSWLFVVTFEPDSTWGTGPEHVQHKLIDSASTIAATLNNIGPGLGIIGATQNYAHFTPVAKLLFTWLMMVGRLEIFVILVLFVPAFWRSR